MTSGSNEPTPHPQSLTTTSKDATDQALHPQLEALAETAGVASSYLGSDGERVHVPPETVLYTLRELGYELPSDPSALPGTPGRTSAPILPPTVTAIAGQPQPLSPTVPDTLATDDSESDAAAELTLTIVAEDGITFDPSLPTSMPLRPAMTLPALPAGWHELQVHRGKTLITTSTLLVSPPRLTRTATFINSPATGVMAQLYSLRDAGAWGIGDFHTLTTLSDALADLGGADFILINPVHAGQPVPPIEDSPYLPTTRRYVNPLYLRIEDTPEYQALIDSSPLKASIDSLAATCRRTNSAADIINRDPIYDAKLRALAGLFDALHAPAAEHPDDTWSDPAFAPARIAAVATFTAAEGVGLHGYATWCADQAATSAAAVAEIPSSVATPEFHCWVQLLCREQQEAAQRHLEQTMRIGLLADLAVGVHPDGADAATLRPVMAPGASVGAPPDFYNQQGQDWSQPPWHPQALAAAGYGPWRELLRSVLRGTGGLRIDHILGLFRLWWIPRGQDPSTGTYVSYDHEAMVGALVLEAERAGAIVIGEDLGTFEPWVQRYLAERGIMGTSVLWFEGNEEGPIPPGDYREACLTSVTTHDLPPTASYLRGDHIRLREELGVLTRSPEEEFADDAKWQSRVLGSVAAHGGFAEFPAVEEYFSTPEIDRKPATDTPHEDNRWLRPGGADGLTPDSPDSDTDQAGGADSVGSGIIQGMHAYLAATPSALRCAAVTDLVGDLRTQNQPGTTQELYPNWRIPLCDHSGAAISVEELGKHDLARSVLNSLKGNTR